MTFIMSFHWNNFHLKIFHHCEKWPCPSRFIWSTIGISKTWVIWMNRNKKVYNRGREFGGNNKTIYRRDKQQSYLNQLVWHSQTHLFISSLTIGFFPISSVQSLSRVWLFTTPWTAALQASLSITNSRRLLRLMSIELVMPSSHLILCHPLLLLPWVVLGIRVFSNASVLHIKWPKYWSFSFNLSPSNEYLDWFPLGLTGWISLQSKGLSRVFSSTIVQNHKFFSAQLSL